MIKTKLITLSTIATLALGGIAPMAANADASFNGETEAILNINPDAPGSKTLSFDQAPNMDFGSVGLQDLISGSVTQPLTGTTRDDKPVPTDNTLKISDTRDLDDKYWELTASMTNFKGSGQDINVDDITMGNLTASTGAVTGGKKISKVTSKVLDSTTDGAAKAANARAAMKLGTDTVLNLPRNSHLDSTTTGAHKATMTWTLSDAPQVK